MGELFTINSFETLRDSWEKRFVDSHKWSELHRNLEGLQKFNRHWKIYCRILMSRCKVWSSNLSCLFVFPWDFKCLDYGPPFNPTSSYHILNYLIIFSLTAVHITLYQIPVPPLLTSDYIMCLSCKCDWTHWWSVAGDYFSTSTGNCLAVIINYPTTKMLLPTEMLVLSCNTSRERCHLFTVGGWLDSMWQM